LKNLVKFSRPAKFVSKNAGELKEGSFVKKLLTEHKTSSEKLSDAITAANKGRDELQKTLLPRIRELNKTLGPDKQIDISIFDDLGGLTDQEAKILQRMDAAGNLSRRDRLMLAGQKAARERLEGISKKWVDFSRKMALVDDVAVSSKRIYNPYTGWVRRNGKTLDEYDFRMRKTKNVSQSASEFRSSAVDRYFKSSIDDVAVERANLVKEYDEALVPLRDNVEQAYNKLPWYYRADKKNVPGRVARFIAGNTPTKLWKKSVLKYRPAWYVNNVLYNTQAAALAGGGSAVLEQMKMLRPKYFKKAMGEVPESVKSNLAKEIGRDRIGRFGNRVENWSRVAAFRGAKSKGLTDEQALKRVNSYLFDYSIKNWERPFRSVIPFWSFHKNVLKASAKMPFDRPAAAIGYNRLDRYQQQQFDQDFDATIPELKELGYSDEEIEKFRQDQAKYFRGKLRIGGKYINTPFNAFSEKQMSQFGINPWLSSAREVADSEDNFGRKIKGGEAGFVRRILSKFPQVEIGRQYKLKRDVDAGRLKPEQKYIGEAGSEGYGLGKVKQGYDPSKPNYVESMDPRRKFGQNLLALAGVPRSMEFERKEFIKSKRLQKVTQEYFSTDWRSMKWEDQQKSQEELFKKFGMTADDFYKGILAKYDSENTTRIKGMKEDAREKNESLLAEYGRQPHGTRSAWAARKLKQLVETGYYKDNPFLYSFVKSSKHGKDQGWLTPDTIAKAEAGAAKKADYDYAMRTGDWSKYRAKYGTKSSAKKVAYDQAKASGDFSEYRKQFGAKETPYKHAGKFFKSAESMQKYIEGEFWRRYAGADKDERKKLLADNPQYDTRSSWTSEQWNAWRSDRKQTEIGRLMNFSGTAAIFQRVLGENKAQAKKWQGSRPGRKRKITYV
jgi:hypothetical protein